jgi:ATP-binding cassette subfamily F protein uup
VAQEPELNPDDTVFDAVASGLSELKALLSEYHQVTQQLTQPMPIMKPHWRA